MIAPGDGIEVATQKMLEAVGVPLDAIEPMHSGNRQQASSRLKTGRVDAMIDGTGIGAAWLVDVIGDGRFKLLSLSPEEIDAISGKYSEFSRTTIPAGSYKGQDEDVQTLANCGVVTASSGNHGLGVAYMGNRLGVSVTVIVPESCVPSKIEGLYQLGAQVIFHGHSSIERREYAYELAETKNLMFIHSHDDPHIIAGQGSIGLEILDFLPEVGCVLVPVGGGGLIAGIASAIKELRPGIKVLGVEPEIGCCMKMSLEQGVIVELPDTPETIADGLRWNRPGELPFEIVQRTIDDILTVREQAICEAVRRFHRLGKIVVEPSGAVVAAAIIENKVPFFEKPICAVLSGGNIDESILINDILGTSEWEV